MNRKDFFKNTSLALLGTSLMKPFESIASNVASQSMFASAKNIIFLVSDGMSVGTLQLADTLKYRKEGVHSHWLQLIQSGKASRALMDTASASSIVTDSAAGSSAWGGGVRVPNGSLNVNADGSFNEPIWKKFKKVGKSVGCVTSVPITHATPAGFCVNRKSRSSMESIALEYIDLRFDVMMGGGEKVFSPLTRKDKQDAFDLFRKANFHVLRDTKDLKKTNLKDNKPILGVFHKEESLPYSIDTFEDKHLQATVPTLADMTKAAIEKLNQNKKGFVLQVEGGQVDWAAHANDAAALLYEQLAFDEALKVAIDFAEKDNNTLLIITTDHGNANPGIFYGKNANKNFDRFLKFKHSNNWILMGVQKNFSANQLIERIEYAQGYAISKDEAEAILDHYDDLEEGLYNAYKLPFKSLARIQEKYTSVGFGSMDHSGDYVELTMYGPGSTLLPPFIKNYELHNFMLRAGGLL